jgi:hypothetical protein
MVHWTEETGAKYNNHPFQPALSHFSKLNKNVDTKFQSEIFIQE